MGPKNPILIIKAPVLVEKHQNPGPQTLVDTDRNCKPNANRKPNPKS